jgi:serine/threonine protein kinase
MSSNIFAVKELKLSDREQVAQRWAAEVKALAMMNTLHQDHIVRFITAFRRGSSEMPEYYLMFEWADGGNLHDLWRTIPEPSLTAPTVKWVIRQLHGLAKALSAVHCPKSAQGDTGASWRHGDLKPENILWFRDDNRDRIGTLKIGDWGEAKSHKMATAMRQSNTTARYGTRRYEPPECQIGVGSTHPGQGGMRRSRLYDIWSFGCITLETIVWLLYGNTGLRKFSKSMNESPFYQVKQRGKIRSAEVHDVVVSWINYISQDAACHPGVTALGDLLELVQRGLLVVTLPELCSVRNNTLAQAEAEAGIPKINVTLAEDEPGIPTINVTLAEEIEANNAEMHPGPSIKIPSRYRADELRDKLELIEHEDEVDGYWSTQRELPMPDITSDQHSISDSQICYEGSTQSYRDYDYAMPLYADEHRNNGPLSTTKTDLVLRDSVPHKQSKKTTNDDQDDEVYFITRGRPLGSKNKRSAQTTTVETKTSTSESSSQRRSKSKRRRVEGDGGDDGNNEEDQDDQDESLPGKGSRDSQKNLNLACPFAKKIPLEYPRCRGDKFRDNAKVK